MLWNYFMAFPSVTHPSRELLKLSSLWGDPAAIVEAHSAVKPG
jgi:hypothetical protein